MPSLNMNGAYDFDSDTIKDKVEEEEIGNYALGYVKDNSFYVKYVGRSDNDLQKELIARLEKNHSKFKFSYASSDSEAYKKECQNYHDFKPEENEIHPASTAGKNLICHICEK